MPVLLLQNPMQWFLQQQSLGFISHTRRLAILLLARLVKIKLKTMQNEKDGQWNKQKNGLLQYYPMNDNPYFHLPLLSITFDMINT